MSRKLSGEVALGENRPPGSSLISVSKTKRLQIVSLRKQIATYGVIGMKDRCFEPRDGVADGPEVALPVLDEEPSARGVSRTNFRNCWLFIGELLVKRGWVCLF